MPKVESARIHGCESQAWLHYYYNEETRRICFLADADARNIRGLICIVLAAFNNKTPEAIRQFDLAGLFDRLDLPNHLSASRNNGLNALVASIESIARPLFLMMKPSVAKHSDDDIAPDGF